MSIKIITDSASDLAQNQLENVIVVPLKVTINGTTYRDGIDMSKDEFYNMLENSDVLPTTSLASPAEFEEIYQKVTDDHDEALVLTVSSKVSGTYQSAVIAAEDFDNISVVDTIEGAAGEAILVLRALELIKQGLSRDEIAKIIDEEKHKIKLYAVVDTLKYLEKGGRVSKGIAIFGGILGIKPILTLEDGELIAIGKARGSKKAYRFLTEKLEESGGIDFSKPFFTGYSGTSKENLDRYIEDNKYLLGEHAENIPCLQIGSAVGTHAGPGAILITYFANK